jgi:hypothetical protein
VKIGEYKEQLSPKFEQDYKQMVSVLQAYTLLFWDVVNLIPVRFLKETCYALRMNLGRSLDGATGQIAVSKRPCALRG